MSIRSTLIIGFCMVTIPLVCFLFYTNNYSIKVVRDQMTVSSSDMLTLYGDQIDRIFENGNTRLYMLANREPAIRSLVYNIDSKDEYALTRLAVHNKLNADLPYYDKFFMAFVYNPLNQDLIMAQQYSSSYKQYTSILTSLSDLLQHEEQMSAFEHQWTSRRIGEEQYLIRIVKTDTNTYVGALINQAELTQPLNLVATNQLMEALYLTEDGSWLSTPPADAADKVSIAVREGKEPDRTYQTVKGKENYLLVYNKMEFSNLVLGVMISEKAMLRNVSFFKSINYLIPFAAVALLLGYLVFFQRLMLRPMQLLIRGMNKLSEGNLNIRLFSSFYREYSLINATFNKMASQIKDLKINVYEEELRTHKAEMKQLQLQINPHFLFNSINIIYSLAEMKQFLLIQKMSRHLVNYFRFFASLSEHIITIEDEIDNLEDYLQIQKMRFPKHLDYQLQVDDGLGTVQIPPLTIQPFVENAIKHGFSIHDKVFLIRVHVRVYSNQESRLCEIIVEDTGTGFPAEFVGSMPGLLNGRSYTNSHIGIWNVYHRIQMYYKENIELVLENRETGGARVRIRFPYTSTAQ